MSASIRLELGAGVTQAEVIDFVSRDFGVFRRFGFIALYEVTRAYVAQDHETRTDGQFLLKFSFSGSPSYRPSDIPSFGR